MPRAVFILVGCQLAGEVLRQALGLPLPGPLVGMFLLASILVLNGRHAQATPADIEPPLLRTANGLISNMGLLFVPAGVGVIVQAPVLRAEWLPILAGLIVSTVLGLVVTGLVMSHVTRSVETRRLPSRAAAAGEAH